MFKMGKTLEKINLNFDDPTVQETEMHQKMAEEIELSQSLNKSYGLEISARVKRINTKNPERYDRLLVASKKAGIMVEKIGADSGRKANLLINIMGYSFLKGPKNERILTSSAKPERIGNVYKNCIETAKKIQIH